MSEFFNHCNVKATRKEHRCTACSKSIPIGSSTFYFSQKYDGLFYAGHYHLECRAAEIALNDLHGLSGEEWIALDSIDEDEDRDWLRDKHPLVAERLGLLVQEPKP